MTCLKIEELIGLYIYDELTAKERALVEAHLETCPDCQARLERFQQAGAQLSETYRDTPDIDWDHNWQNIRQQLHGDAKPGVRGKSETRSSLKLAWLGIKHLTKTLKLGKL